MPLGNKNYPCIMAVDVSSRHAVHAHSSSAAAVPAHQAQVYRDDGREPGEQEVKREAKDWGAKCSVSARVSLPISVAFC